jgi:hypothetical protein
MSARVITDTNGVADLGAAPDPAAVVVQATTADGGPIPGIGVQFYAPARPTKRLWQDLGVPRWPEPAAVKIAGALTDLATKEPRAEVLIDGEFHLERVLHLVGLRDLRIIGQTGSAFRRAVQEVAPSDWPRKQPFYPYLLLQDCIGLSLEEIAVQGPLEAPVYASALENCHAFQVHGGCSDLRIVGCSAQGVHGDLFTISEHQQRQPGGILVEDFTGTIAGRQLVAVVGGQGRETDGGFVPALRMRRFDLHGAGRSGIDMEPSTPLGAHDAVFEDGRLADVGLYLLAGGNRQLHHNMTFRRVHLVGGRGPAKWGLEDGTDAGTHVGLTLEDVIYEPLPPGPKVLTGGLSIRGTRELLIRGCQFHLRQQGLIEGTGRVEESIFTSFVTPPPDPVVCLRGVESWNNIGAASCA